MLSICMTDFRFVLVSFSFCSCLPVFPVIVTMVTDLSSTPVRCLPVYFRLLFFSVFCSVTFAFDKVVDYYGS